LRSGPRVDCEPAGTLHRPVPGCAVQARGPASDDASSGTLAGVHRCRRRCRWVGRRGSCVLGLLQRRWGRTLWSVCAPVVAGSGGGVASRGSYALGLLERRWDRTLWSVCALAVAGSGGGVARSGLVVVRRCYGDGWLARCRSVCGCRGRVGLASGGSAGRFAAVEPGAVAVCRCCRNPVRTVAIRGCGRTGPRLRK
jgi:hypothetical protein